MTLEGEALLKEELQRLKFEERPSVIDAIARAREFGDLKENAEYHAAKEQQSLIEARIKEGKISVISPVAKSLIGKFKGDIVKVETPGGTKEYEIINVKYI